jgi:hypothetical protein
MRRLGDLKTAPAHAVQASQTAIANVERGHLVALYAAIAQTVLAAPWPSFRHNRSSQPLECPHAGASSGLPYQRAMAKPDRRLAPYTGRVVECSKRFYRLRRSRASATLVWKREFRLDQDRVATAASRERCRDPPRRKADRLAAR